MNVEFHYYIIYYLATEAGFSNDDASIIAHSSQFVDSNLVPYSIDTEKGPIQTDATQNYSFWDMQFAKEVYIPFHFFPSLEKKNSRRKDETKNPYNCVENSRPVKDLLIAALKTKNLYRIGIALHTFADSFAHQNFSGLKETWNKVEDKSIIPPLGHAQAQKKPDDISLIWEDSRLKEKKVVNRERHMRAAKKIYKYLSLYNKRSYDDSELIISQLDEIIGRQGNEFPVKERLLNFQIHLNIEAYNRKLWINDAISDPWDPGEEEFFNGYNKILWLKDTLFHQSKILNRHHVKSRKGFFDSHFYKWNEAAKAHKNQAKQILGPIL